MTRGGLGQRGRQPRFEPLESRRVLAASVMITEFMASNGSTLADGDGAYSDWIEIHNPAAEAVSLSGWYLTDDPTQPAKWAFPDVDVESRGYLVVFASAPVDAAGAPLHDYVDAGGFLHTNFALGAEGEYLALTQAGAGGQMQVVQAFSPSAPPQSRDVSYGLSQSIDRVTLVDAAAHPAKAIVPGNGQWDATQAGQAPAWMLRGFDDSAWQSSGPSGGTGVGFDFGDDEGSDEPPPPPSTGDAVALPNGPLGRDLTDPEQDGVLNATITVGNPAAPAGEEARRALDNFVSSKWLSFEPEGDFFQVRLQGGPRTARAYTLTSANDAPDRDPYSWRLSGSHDGVTYTVLDMRVAHDFPSRFQTFLFQFENETAYEFYRFDFQTEFGATGANRPVAIQLAEIELLDASEAIEPGGNLVPGGLIGGDLTDPEDDGVLAGTFTVGNANSPEGEEPVRALDNTTSTKWLSFEPAGTFYQFQFAAGPQLVNAYTLTSANDAPERDPYRWTLSGSLNGSDFVVLDTREAQDFGGRFETRWYSFENSAPYAYYRFDFQTEFGATGANQPVAIQIAEIELFADGPVDFTQWIDTDVEAAWNATPTSIYQRIAFDVADPAAFSELWLNLQYDDGFAAYLNGVRVAEAAAPAALSYASRATGQRKNSAALVSEEFDLSAHLDLLVPGTNVLAIHGLNVDADSADMLLRSELVAVEVVDPTLRTRYYPQPTPGATNGTGVEGIVAAPQFSVQRGFFDAPFTVALQTATAGAQIYYTLDGSTPNAVNGLPYDAPILVDGSATLRAVAVKDDFLGSPSVTHTYLFLNDVVRQDYQATLDAGFPASWGGVQPDYGMDPDVIGTFDATGASLGGDRFAGRYAAQIFDSLQAIPTLSIVMDIDDLFGPNGIYTTPTASGVAWERAASVELIHPDGSPGFQANAGLRTQGGAFRRHDLSRKHSLRLLFKSDYGPTKLEFPWFGPDAVDEFDTVTLRMDSNDGWAWASAGAQPQYARDEFGRRTQLALGRASGHGTRVHLYLNGVYWGLYNPVERPDASFSASYYGGDKSEWDALNAGTVVDGDAVSWNTLRNLSQAVANAGSEASRLAAYMAVQGKRADGTDDLNLENYLDVDNYIDYLLINFYAGNADWPHRNWFASRQRGPESTGFKFHIWDMESALNLLSDVNTNRLDVSSHVAEPYGYLRSSAEFRIQFADRAHRALFNDGPLTTAAAMARYQEILDEIEVAIVAESARWGDMHRSTPYTAADWEAEAARVMNNFLAGRTRVLINQLRSAGLYPNVQAPAFSQRGGQVAAGFDLQLVNANGSGVVYYTIDGSDPRALGGAVAPSAMPYAGPLSIDAATLVRTRVWNAGQWSAIDEAQFTIAPPANAGNLRVTELQFNPHNANLGPIEGELNVDNDEFEFVELRNVGTGAIDLDGVRFVETVVGSENQGMQFVFGQRTLAPGEHVVVVSNLAAFQSRYGVVPAVAGQYQGRLANGGETLTLVAANGDTIQQFAYNDAWASRADGLGSSLIVVDLAGDYDAASNWRSSAAWGGAPGQDDDASSDVVFNELRPQSASLDAPAVELFNASPQTVDLSGWWLTDDLARPFQVRLPAGTTLAAGGYLVLDAATLQPGGGSAPTDVTLAAAGATLWLLEADSDGTPIRFADAAAYGPAAAGVTFGRVPNGDPSYEIFPLATESLGAANGPHRVGPLVVSEVHYHPAPPPAGALIAEQQLEFVEVANRSAEPVLLNAAGVGAWRLANAVTFDFAKLPLGSSLAPGAVLTIVPFDPANATLAHAFRSVYGIGPDVALVGPYTGQLDNAGETLELRSPAPTVGSGATTLIDRVAYDDAVPWPLGADGDGPSLRRRGAGQFGDLATSWEAGSPTPGSTSWFGAPTADFTGDGVVDQSDLVRWEQSFGMSSGASTSLGDANGDGDVDGGDLLAWQRSLFAAAPASAPTSDFNGDAAVDSADLLLWEAGWGLVHFAQRSDGDGDGDGHVTGRDFLAWQREAWEAAPVAVASATAPQSFAEDEQSPWAALDASFADFAGPQAAGSAALPWELAERADQFRPLKRGVWGRELW